MTRSEEFLHLKKLHVPVQYSTVSEHHRYYKFYYKSLYHLQILIERCERLNPNRLMTLVLLK